MKERDVFVIYRVSPEDVSVDLESIVDKIKNIVNEFEGVSVKDYKIEPFAFGIKILRIGIIMPDKGGIVDVLLDKIKEIEGVSEVDVESCELI